MEGTNFSIWLSIVIILAITSLRCLPTGAQVSKEALDTISTPDQVETSIGKLKFLDGAPYPLASKDNPPKMEFISGSGKAFNTIHANDHTFYEHLNKVIQEEPLEMLDPETRGLFASIGMEKGKPFEPDERMKKILTDSTKIANAAARSNVWYPRVDGTMKGIEVYPGENSAWMMGGWTRTCSLMVRAARL